MIDIKIKDEYAKLVPALSEGEYNQLRQSIREKGFWSTHPVVINKDGYILDGHHRFRIGTELGIEVPHIVKTFDNELQEKLFVVDSNLTRRQLSVFARIELALKRKPILEQLAKLNMSLGGKGVRIQTPLGRIDQKIADSAQSTKGQVRNVQVLLKSASPEVLDELRQGKAKISAELYRIEKAKIRQERFELAKQSVAKSKDKNKNLMFDLRLGDMRELGKQIPDNSIDMIFTDPPYEAEYIHLYDDLAKLAQRVLKPGGSLVFFMGHFHEDEIKGYFNKYPKLVENHRFIILHTGAISALKSQRIWPYYKPLLHYYKLKENGKRPLPIHDLADVIKSEGPPKDDHDWEQSPIEARYMIEPFTVEDELVLDPFVSVGTTAIAARQLNRRIIGFDIDEKALIIAKDKLLKLGSKPKIGITLQDRINNYSKLFPMYPSSLLVSNGAIYGTWVIGNYYANDSKYYGAYPHGLLERIKSLFPDCKAFMHLFSGSISESESQDMTFDIKEELNPTIRSDVRDIKKYKKDFGKADVVIADPPYSDSDFKKYGCESFDKKQVFRDLAEITRPRTFLAWLDTTQPFHRNEDWKPIGNITVLVSTNHRVRCFFLYQNINANWTN